MPASPFEKPVPGRLFVWVKRVSWVELWVFAGLLAFWLLPGFETETMVFGWAHGLGFIALCVLIWVTASNGRLLTPCSPPPSPLSARSEVWSGSS